MKFEIDFNRETDDKMLELVGAKLENTGLTKNPPFEVYYIEIPDFEELEKILKKVDHYKNGLYSAVISFDPATIYLEKDV